MTEKVKTRVFHGGRFKQRTVKAFSNEANKEKERLQRQGRQVRITKQDGKHVLWTRG